MIYNIFVFITNSKLLAINIMGVNNSEKISINGNDSMNYHNNADISVFINYVKEYFNVEGFSDIDINVNVINLRAKVESAVFLLQELVGVKNLSCQDGNVILPVVLGLKNTFKNNGEKIKCKIIDVEYGIAISEDGNINCNDSENGEEVELQPEDFCILIQLNRENFDGLGAKYKVMYEEIEKKLQDNKKMCEELKERNTTIEEQLSNCKAKLAKYTDATNRCVMKCDIDDFVDNTINRIAKDNSVVKKGKEIGRYIPPAEDMITGILGLGTKSPYFRDAYDQGLDVIKAEQDGRIFWLKEKDEKVKANDAICIIGNLYDTREAVMEWYCNSDRVVTKAALYKAIKK